MTDKKNGPAVLPLKASSLSISLCYGSAICVRGLLYKYGIFKSEKVPMKVISVAISRSAAPARRLLL